tara:strand:- start:293 stop:592 length:300 start_codon:yes stop_codon:yes gene_type:complete
MGYTQHNSPFKQSDKKTLKKTYPKVDSNYLMAKGFDVKSDTVVNLGRQGHRVDAIPHTNISRMNMKGSMGEGKNVIMKKEDIWWDKPKNKWSDKKNKLK